MSKKKFVLSSDFVEVKPEKPVETTISSPPTKNKNIDKRKLNYTGPNTNRVKFSNSLDASLKNEFKIWVAQKESDMSTELENAIKLLMRKN